MKFNNIIISGTGSFVPEASTPNQHFANREFYNPDHSLIEADGEEVISKFEKITGIASRRYVGPALSTSDIAATAAKIAIEEAGIDAETIDQIIVGHNVGDVKHGSIQSDTLPCVAARVKHNLGIKNPNCVAYDIIFGCPGWLQGLIQARAYMLAGQAKSCLVIGAETLSRAIDPHDRDSMIYSDGAGATLLELVPEESPRGIKSVGSKSFTVDETYFIFWGKSNKPGADPHHGYLKMHGRKIYEFALREVPAAMKECLDASGHSISELKKIFIHQANEKMDDAIVQRFFKLYGINETPNGVMPMSIHTLGNSSVATVPTLYDLVRKGQLEGQGVSPGDVVMFASVGAGMHVNAATYVV